MKKIKLCLAVFLLAAIPVFGSIVYQNEAKEAALAFIKIENALQKRDPNFEPLSLRSLSELNYQNEKIGYLAELSPRGFMIISAIDELAPLRLMTFSKDFNVMDKDPFFEAVCEELLQAVIHLGYYLKPESSLKISKWGQIEASNLLSIKKNQHVWRRLLTDPEISADPRKAVTAEVQPLMKDIQWDQGWPYNLKTPIINGIKTPLGCVPTAYAQILKYWNFPPRGHGCNFYTNFDADGVTPNAENYANFDHTYEWNLMKNSYTGSEKDTDVSVKAVARLCYDVAVMCWTQFDPTGSSGGGMAGLASFLHFSTDARDVYRDCYEKLEEWFLELKNQIDKSWPVVLYLGPRYGGFIGHAVVMDGYRQELGQNLITLNWPPWGIRYYYPVDVFGAWTIDAANINIYPEDMSHVGAISGDITAFADIRSDIPKSNFVVTLHRQEKDSKNSHEDPDIKLARTNSNGKYELSEIKPGIYKVLVWSGLTAINGHLPEDHRIWYNNKSSFDEADLVTVQEGQTTINIDPVSFEVSISGSRKASNAWAIRKYFGEITINTRNRTYFPQLQTKIYRKTNGGEYVLIKEYLASDIQQDEILLLDKYLENDKRYAYRIEAKSYPDREIIYSNEIVL